MGRLTAHVWVRRRGGFPQWNCRCRTCRLAWALMLAMQPRAGESCCHRRPKQLLINASRSSPGRFGMRALRPRDGTRGSPIKAVLLTGAEIDQIAGLLSLREREPFLLCPTAVTLAALAENAMFGVLTPGSEAQDCRCRNGVHAPRRIAGASVHGAGGCAYLEATAETASDTRLTSAPSFARATRASSISQAPR
jgi:coenzyme PQQ biosynthesis protein B